MLVLAGANVWTGVGKAALEDQCITIRDGTIHDIRSSGAAPRFGAQCGQHGPIETVDCSGKWIIPGLIDLHVHFVWGGSLDPVGPLLAADPLLSAIRATGNAAKTLRSGITRVRDLGSTNDIAIHLARAIREGTVPGPSIVASGRTVVMTGGHDPFWGNMADGVDAVLRATREQVYAGADIIKVSATGGVYGRTEGEDAGASELNLDELTVIAAEAHKFGLQVVAHAIGHNGIHDALHAGIDTIEHGHYLTPELLDFMAANNRTWVPTLHIYQRIAAGHGIPAYAQRKAEAILDRQLSAFDNARRRGVRIGAGSDAGSPDLPHPALSAELQALVKAGMTTWEALESATSGAAASLGSHGELLGRLAPGYVADLVVLDTNPLADVSAVESVRMVVQSGKRVVCDGRMLLDGSTRG